MANRTDYWRNYRRRNVDRIRARDRERKTRPWKRAVDLAVRAICRKRSTALAKAKKNTRSADISLEVQRRPAVFISLLAAEEKRQMTRRKSSHKSWLRLHRKEVSTKACVRERQKNDSVREQVIRILAKDKRWFIALLALEFRKQNPPHVRARRNLSNRVRRILKGKDPLTTRMHRLIGCSVSELRQHLERSFKPDFTWDNYGRVWHVDHIHPLCSFDLTDPKQACRALHFSNLQPLRARANLKKGSKITTQQLRLL